VSLLDACRRGNARPQDRIARRIAEPFQDRGLDRRGGGAGVDHEQDLAISGTSPHSRRDEHQVPERSNANTFIVRARAVRIQRWSRTRQRLGARSTARRILRPRSLTIRLRPARLAGARSIHRSKRRQGISIDGVDLESGTDTRTLNAGLTPANLDETHRFIVQDLGATEPRTVVLISTRIVRR
jgi:hypothetical protein